jgi:hypothetical protein
MAAGITDRPWETEDLLNTPRLGGVPILVGEFLEEFH